MAGMDDYLTTVDQPQAEGGPAGQFEAPQAPAPTPLDVKHSAKDDIRGPFGSKGTLGGVLGILGDIVLTSAGLPAQYLPKLQHAKEADAIADFATDPQGAFTKLAAVSGADKAQDFYSNYLLGQQRVASTAKTQQEAEQAKQIAPLQIAKAGQEVMPRLYAIAKSVPAGAKRQDIDQTYKMLTGYASKYNLSLDTLPNLSGLSDDDAVNALHQWSMEGVPVKDQISQAETAAYHKTQADQGAARIDNAKAQVGIAARNADTSAGRAGEQARHNRVMENKTPVVKQTEAGVVQGLIDKQANGDTLSQGEKARVKKFTEGVKGNTNRFAPTGSAPAIPSSHVTMLKGNPTPQMRSFFDQKYGAGAAAKILGK